MPNRTEEIAVTLIATTFILFLLGFYYKVLVSHRNKQSKYFENIERLKDQHTKDILAMQLEIQEFTFKKIAQEIHDNISLTLTLAKLNVNTFLMSQTHLRFEQLHSATDLIGRSLLDLNNISRSLNSDIVAHYGLIRAAEMEFDKLNQFGKCEFRFEADPHLRLNNPTIDLELFRIIQEASNNILKHAEASQARVSIIRREQELELTITDNGKGFDDDILAEKRSIAPRSGLKNIQNRAHMLQGQAKIESTPDRGTSIQIIIPIPHDTTTH